MNNAILKSIFIENVVSIRNSTTQIVREACQKSYMSEFKFRGIFCHCFGVALYLPLVIFKDVFVICALKLNSVRN